MTGRRVLPAMVAALLLDPVTATISCADLMRATVRTAGDSLAARAGQEYNAAITGLAMTKSMADGTMTITFKVTHERRCPPCQYLVRLFDKNGVYLTHFLTARHLELFGVDRRQGPVTLTYRVNLRDLRDAEQAEFGYWFP